MKLTPAILASCYALLREMEPFCRWHLPPSEDVRFKVIHTKRLFGDYNSEPNHCIRVSEAKHNRLSRVLETVAHEMCHTALHVNGCRAAGAHGAEFKKLAQQVCRLHPDFEYPVF